MPVEMLKVAIRAAYGEDAVKSYSFHNQESNIIKKSTTKISKAKTGKNNAELTTKYKIGDSVMVYPEKKKWQREMENWTRVSLAIEKAERTEENEAKLLELKHLQQMVEGVLHS